MNSGSGQSRQAQILLKSVSERSTFLGTPPSQWRQGRIDLDNKDLPFQLTNHPEQNEQPIPSEPQYESKRPQKIKVKPRKQLQTRSPPIQKISRNDFLPKTQLQSPLSASPIEQLLLHNNRDLQQILHLTGQSRELHPQTVQNQYITPVLKLSKPLSGDDKPQNQILRIPQTVITIDHHEHHTQTSLLKSVDSGLFEETLMDLSPVQQIQLTTRKLVAPILLQMNDIRFQQSPKQPTKHQDSASVSTKRLQKLPSTKNLKSNIKFITEVSQPIIELASPHDLAQKIIEVKKIRQQNKMKKMQRISPAQMNFLQQQKLPTRSRNVVQLEATQVPEYGLKVIQSKVVLHDIQSQKESGRVTPQSPKSPYSPKYPKSPSLSQSPSLRQSSKVGRASKQIINEPARYINLPSIKKTKQHGEDQQILTGEKSLAQVIAINEALNSYEYPLNFDDAGNTIHDFESIKNQDERLKSQQSIDSGATQPKLPIQSLDVANQGQRTDLNLPTRVERRVDLPGLGKQYYSLSSISTENEHQIVMRAKIYGGEQSQFYNQDQNIRIDSGQLIKKKESAIIIDAGSIMTMCLPTPVYVDGECSPRTAEEFSPLLTNYQPTQVVKKRETELPYGFAKIDLNLLIAEEFNELKDDTFYPNNSNSEQKLVHYNSRNQMQVNTKSNASLLGDQQQKTGNFYNKLAQRFKAKSFDSVFTARERQQIISDMLFKPEMVISEWINRQKKNFNFLDTSGLQVKSPNGLVLPPITNISPRFASSIGSQLKDRNQQNEKRKIKQGQLSNLSQLSQQQITNRNQQLIDNEALLKKAVMNRHENVTSLVKNEYHKRVLDAQGHWKDQVGRKLQINQEEMALRDYSNSKFFSNPLKPSYAQLQGLHQLPNVNDILQLKTPEKSVMNIKQNDLEITPQASKLVVIQVPRESKKKSRTNANGSQLTTLNANQSPTLITNQTPSHPTNQAKKQGLAAESFFLETSPQRSDDQDLYASQYIKSALLKQNVPLLKDAKTSILSQEVNSIQNISVLPINVNTKRKYERKNSIFD